MLIRMIVAFDHFRLWLLVLAIFFTGCAKSTVPDDAGTTATTEAAVTEFKLIPRDVLFGNPERTQARISPDGKWLSFLAPFEGVMNVWVGPIDDVAAAEPVTEETVRPIPQYHWAYDSQHILYPQDKDGNENFHVYATDVQTRETKDLTPIDGVQARVTLIDRAHPDEILVAINDRTPRHHDVYRIDTRTGERALVFENTAGLVQMQADAGFHVRLAVRVTPDGGQSVLTRDGPDEAWYELVRWNLQDAAASRTIGFSRDGRTIYLVDSRRADTGRLFAYALDGAAPARYDALAADTRADAGAVVLDPRTGRPQAVAFDYARRRWKLLDDAIRADWEVLSGLDEGEMSIVSRDLDDERWIVSYDRADGPTAYYLYRRGERRAALLFTSRAALETLPLAGMRAVVIRARDGLDLRTLLESIPPYWEPIRAMFEARVGRLDERARLELMSPLTRVEEIRRPLLIGQGRNDPRVKEAQSRRIVEAMEARGLPVTYVLFPDEGHGFARPENNLAFFAIAEAFLARHLGGRCEPIGDAVRRSSARIEAGAELIPGLE